MRQIVMRQVKQFLFIQSNEKIVQIKINQNYGKCIELVSVCTNEFLIYHSHEKLRYGECTTAKRIAPRTLLRLGRYILIKSDQGTVKLTLVKINCDHFIFECTAGYNAFIVDARDHKELELLSKDPPKKAIPTSVNFKNYFSIKKIMTRAINFLKYKKMKCLKITNIIKLKNL